MPNKETSTFCNSFISINRTSVKCLLGKHTVWYCSELGINFPSIHALLFCLKWKAGQYAIRHATPHNFIICKKKAWVTKLEKQEVTFLVTKKTVYSFHAGGWMLREVKNLFQNVCGSSDNCTRMEGFIFCIFSLHCVSGRWISIRIRSN